MRSVVVLIGMPQKYKDSPSCRSGEINSGVDRNVSIWSTRWIVFVLLRHSYQHHYSSHLIYRMDCLCTSETFISTPLLISPDLQYGRSLYFWDISINTTTDFIWSTRWTVLPLLRHCYQHHYWSHLIYKIDWLCTSEKFLSEINSGLDSNVSEVQSQFIL
jgi:hypothetical protein